MSGRMESNEAIISLYAFLQTWSRLECKVRLVALCGKLAMDLERILTASLVSGGINNKEPR